MESRPNNTTPPLISTPGKPFAAESVQEMWRMVLDALRDPVFLHDRNYCITRANWVYASRAGLSFAELIGKPYWQVFPKGTGPFSSCVQAMANPSGPELDEVVEFDGSTFLSRNIPVANVRGEYLYSVHIMEDITPIQQSASMVNRSEEQFRLVSEAIAEVFWMADIALERIYYVSPGYERIWGRSRSELYQNPRLFVDAVHPDDRERVLADLAAQKSGQAFDHTCRVVATDGTMRWIWSRGFPMEDDTGHYGRYLGVALDITEQKQTEQMLLESEKTYLEIFDKAGEAMLVHDPVTAEIYDANQAFCQLLGYTREELLRLSVAQLSSDQSDATQEVARRLVEAASNTQGRHSFEWSSRKKDGTDFWVEVTLASATIRAQPRVLASARDISERKQMEARLQESSQHLKEIQSAMDQAGIAIHWVDADSGRFLYINERCCEMLGYSREELLAMSIPDIDPNFPKDKGHFGDLTAPMRLQVVGRLETVNLHKDGHPIPIETAFHYRESPDRKGKYFIAFVTDINQRKQAEAALRRESDQNGALVALARTMLAEGLSVEGLSKIVVQYAKQLTGSEHGFVSIIDPSNGDNVAYNLTEMMGGDCQITGDDKKIVFPIGADGRYPGLWGHVLNTRQGFYTNAPGERERGLPPSHIPLRNFLSIPAIVADHLVGQLAIANAPHDYTDEDLDIAHHLTDMFAIALQRLHADETIRKLNQTLEQRVQEETAKNREKDLLLIRQSRLAAMGEMVHNIAHQWRQPLSAVSLVLQNIALDYDDNLLTSSSMKEYASHGKELIQKMSVTIDDFRNFFAPTREKMAFSLHQAIDSALHIVSASFLNNGIAIDFERGTDAQATGYPNEFSQVLLNLLGNAKEAILERQIQGGEIDIALGRNEANAWVTIRDNGSGIAEDILPRIFDPYFTTKEKGTGIGLYMSRMIMEHMDGDIAIRNVEGGAEVVLTLPLASSTAA